MLDDTDELIFKMILFFFFLFWEEVDRNYYELGNTESVSDTLFQSHPHIKSLKWLYNLQPGGRELWLRQLINLQKSILPDTHTLRAASP